MELPNIVDTLYSQNALQFLDLGTAEAFLFFIHEDDRVRITHLRIPVPDRVSQTSYTYLDPHDSSDPSHNWHAILNYFSNPWDRKTVCSLSPPSALHFLSVFEGD
jgi:hypothetical protein